MSVPIPSPSHEKIKENTTDEFNIEVASESKNEHVINDAPKQNGEQDHELTTDWQEKYSKNLSPKQLALYNESKDKSNFLKGILDERIRWKFKINAFVTILSVSGTIAIDFVARFFPKDDNTNLFILILNCFVFGIQAFTVILAATNEDLFSSKTYGRAIIVFAPIIIGVVLATFLGIFILPPTITISWIAVGVLGSNLFLQAVEHSIWWE
ncbi:18233_t:CDS:2 [Cetraspora pellucida]|uniref:18233_t:CDS:1 n=1 Tax=Cetraspora pellucida TaxID=1433469 RepID=A0ACA9M5C1_9GLOM|nr:18233_t:CDS:2 [Cetraspora pellucida]